MPELRGIVRFSQELYPWPDWPIRLRTWSAPVVGGVRADACLPDHAHSAGTGGPSRPARIALR